MTTYGAIGAYIGKSTANPIFNSLPQIVATRTFGQRLFHSELSPLGNYIAGHLYTDASKTTVVQNQPVILINKLSWEIVGFTYTDSNGYYLFARIPALTGIANTYMIATPGYTGSVNGLIADNITPVSM